MPKFKSPAFDPRDLRTVRSLCAEGLIPYHFKTAERFCRDGELPAIKVGTFWQTTEVAARTFLWKRANPAFRKVHC
jgi:hypothetical protein